MQACGRGRTEAKRKVGRHAAIQPVDGLGNREASLVVVRCERQHAGLFKVQAQLVEGIKLLVPLASIPRGLGVHQLRVHQAEDVEREFWCGWGPI